MLEIRDPRIHALRQSILGTLDNDRELRRIIDWQCENLEQTGYYVHDKEGERLILNGIIYFKLGEFDIAIKELENANRHLRREGDIWNQVIGLALLGNAYESNRMEHQALQEFESAHRVFTNSRLRIYSKDYSKNVDELELLLKDQLHRSSAQVFFVTAVDHYYAAHYQDAAKNFEMVLGINPDNQSAVEYLKKVKDNLGISEKIKRVPDTAAQLYRRARSNIAAKEIKSAITSLETAIDLSYEAGITFSEAEELLSNIRREYKQPTKPKVFISYSRKYDLDVAKDIYSFLIEKDCTPWMDIYDLIPGQDWESVIIDNIRSCDFFIACLSCSSVSNRGYILKELKEAISVLEQMPESGIYLIPIRIDDCKVPSSLKNRHWLDWSAPNSKANLLKAIKSKNKTS